MEEVPSFKSKVSIRNFPKMKKFRRWRVGGLVKKLHEAYKKKNFILASYLLKDEIKKLESFPGMYCMYRHVIESMLRTSNYGPIHQAKAKALNLEVKDVGKISWNFILSQMMTFPLASQIDKMAFPFQKSGVPIICQDVPHIPEYD